MRRLSWQKLIFRVWLIDLLVLWLAIGLSYWLRQVWLVRLGMSEIQSLWIYWRPVLAVSGLLVLVFKLLGLYRLRSFWFGLYTQYRVISGVLVAWSVTMAVMYLSKYDYSRLVTMVSLAASLVFIYLWRLVFSRWVRTGVKIKQMIVGLSRVGRDYARYCRENLPYIEIVGFVDDRANPRNKFDILGTKSQLVELVAKYRIDEIVVADPAVSTALVFNWLNRAGLQQIRFVFLLTVFDKLFGRFSWIEGEMPTLEPGRVAYGLSKWKRGLDIFLSSLMLLLFWPFILVLAVVTGLVFRRWPFLVQPRVGLAEKRFFMYKLVSMRHDCKQAVTKRSGRRLNRYGRFLRRSSLDELPQLVNVVKGDMALVGPRPEVWSRRNRFVGWQRLRHQARPGMTGLWQVLGRKDLPLYRNVQYDIFYVYNQSLANDLKIMLQTIPAVLSGRGAY